MILSMHLAMAMIYVKDLPRMADFYTNTLGLTPIEDTRTENWLELSAGPIRIGLHAIPAEIAADIEITTPPEPRESTPIKLIFEVADLPATTERLTQSGISVTPRPWGTADILDPEGNIFTLTQRKG